MACSRWLALFPLVLPCLLLFPASLSAQGKEPMPENYHVFIGTYTGGPSKGIYRFEMNAETGKLTPRGLAAETTNPTFLAIHPSHRYLYAVSEVEDFEGKKTGAIKAYALDPKTGNLTFLNQQQSGGAGPCHVLVDKAGTHVLAANYGGGSACVLPIDKDGRLGPATAVVQHKGHGPNAARQEAAHAHSINLDAANKHAFVADLGIDKVMIYRYDAEKGTLTPNDPPSVSLPPGSGPRHFAFHPDGIHAYVINELASTISAMDYNPEQGALKVIETISTLPDGFKGENTCAEVQVHRSGKFVYGSNRGQNSIAIFTVNEKTGKLTPAGREGKDVNIPRNFAIDPSGRLMIIANQDGNSLIVCKIDPQTGGLTPQGGLIETPKPVCVKFVPIPK